MKVSTLSTPHDVSFGFFSFKLYLSPTEQLYLKVDPQGKDEGAAQHGHPRQEPQALGQTNSPLLGELYLQQRHGSLLRTARLQTQEKRRERKSR